MFKKAMSNAAITPLTTSDFINSPVGHSRINFFRKLFFIASSALVISSCGGGGADTGKNADPVQVSTNDVVPKPPIVPVVNPLPPSTQPPTTIETPSPAGKIIISVVLSEPVVGAEVTIKDAQGKTVSGTTDASGQVLVDSIGLVAPLIIRTTVTGISANRKSAVQVDSKAPIALETYALYSYMVDPTQSKVIISPVTTAVMANITGNRNSAAYDLFGGTGVAAMLISQQTVTAAEQFVKNTAIKLGIPESILSHPNSQSALIPVTYPKPTPYDQIISGNLFGALITEISAVVNNAVQFGCNGVAYGTLGDGTRRPSCLPGANQPLPDVAFIRAVEVPRSTDPGQRADELVGVNAPGGGWKYRGDRVSDPERLTKISNKITAILKARDSSGALAKIEPDSHTAIAFLKATNWDTLCEMFTTDTTASEMSDIFHGYSLLKMNLEGKGPFPISSTEASISFPYKYKSVDRLTPVLGPDEGGENIKKLKDFCAMQGKSIVSKLTTLPPPTTDPLPPTQPNLVAPLANSAIAALKVVYPLTDTQASSDRFFQAIYSVSSLQVCTGNVFTQKDSDNVFLYSYCLEPNGTIECNTPATINSFKASYALLTKLATSTDSCVTYGGTTSNPVVSKSAAAAVSGELAQNLIDAYQKKFSLYWAGERQPTTEIYAMKVNIDAGKFSFPFAADFIVPALEKTGLNAVGNSLEQLPLQWVYGQGGRPTDIYTINPELRAGILGCYVADQACMARLARTRQYRKLVSIVSKATSYKVAPLRLANTLQMRAELVRGVEEALFEVELPLVEQ